MSAPLVAAKGKGDSSSSKSSNEKKKVVIGAFDGPKSAAARKAVIAALKDDGNYEVSESSDVKPGDDDKAFAKSSGGAAAVIVGTVKKGTGLTLSVHNGSDGALIQDVEIAGDPGAKLNKSISDTAAASSADAIGQGKAASAAAAKGDDDDKDKDDSDKEKAPEKSDDKKSDAAPASDGSGPSPLELTAGFRAVHRSFDYHDTPAQLYPNAGYGAPLSYSLPLGPAVFIDGTLYPLAFGSKGAAGNFGITGGYELGFATKSVFAENTTRQQNLTTQSNQYYIGLRGRVPLGVHEAGLTAAYGQQVFKLTGGDYASGALFPDVRYQFIRLVADARLHFDDLTVGFHIGTRLVTGVGQLKSTYWFPNTKANSIEAGLMFGYKIVPSLDLVGGVDLVRYGFNFNPIVPGTTSDPNNNVAGGAVDQYVSGWLGARFTLANSASE